MDRTAAVSHSLDLEVPSLNYAGVTVTLGEASDVDLVAGSEGIGRDYVAAIESGDVFEAKRQPS